MALKPRPRRGRPQTYRGWSAPRISPANDPRRRLTRAVGHVQPIESRPRKGALEELPAPTLDSILDDFTQSWDRGETPRAENYLGLLADEDSAELIYHEFCLAEASDLDPDPADYLLRFPEQADSLGRLFALHGAFTPSMLRGWTAPVDLPSSGDEIGPYRLIRELGRGAFARVFLAEQADLDHRLVVLKVSTRATAEPRLMARARHAHIVEILHHVTADDGALHLVCMPFLGGATLASVLEERRKRGRRPRFAADLLSDLDRVAAPEYPSAEMIRPSRELLAGLSYAQGLAWLIARLAEALDHAHTRGVAHGDLKPSNILLTAEANPLLLDFNLSVDWQDVGPGDLTTELGGTLAYMAPERLQAIARAGADQPQKAADLHRADLYAIGLVLLEALTGRVPEIPRRRLATTRELAEELVKLRRSLLDSLSSGDARSIPPALRSILARCLAVDPVDRYARGNDLAEDLDRWRTDRPLIFAAETKTSQLTRKFRRRRAPLLVFGLTMSAAVLVTVIASNVLLGTRREQAVARYSVILDTADPGIFGFRQSLWRVDELGEPVAVAFRQLSRYGVLDDPDWRSRDDVRLLPVREREELELWIFEQILRYATALGETPGSPESWKRGLALLDRTLLKVQSEPLQAARLVLLEKLGQPDHRQGFADVPRLTQWMESYLAGVAAEPLHARQAMGLYLEALKESPELFWGHYRAAVVACRINEYEQGTQHLRSCIDRSPRNPALHALLASVLYVVIRDMPDEVKQDRFADALAACDRALDLDPDFAPAYRIRAKIFQSSSQPGSAEADITRYATLSRRYGPVAAMNLRLSLMFSTGSDRRPLSEAGQSLARKILETNPGDRETRTILATSLAKAGRTVEAIGEYDRVIAGDPESLEARFRRAEQLFKLNRPAALEEFRRLIEHPRFEEVFSEQPRSLTAYHTIATDLLIRGLIPEALLVAEQSLVHVERSRALLEQTHEARRKSSIQERFCPKGWTAFLLAQIHSVASRSEDFTPEVRARHRSQTVNFLKQAFESNPEFRTIWFAKEHLFDDFRVEMVRHLGDR